MVWERAENCMLCWRSMVVGSDEGGTWSGGVLFPVEGEPSSTVVIQEHPEVDESIVLDAWLDLIEQVDFGQDVIWGKVIVSPSFEQDAVADCLCSSGVDFIDEPSFAGVTDGGGHCGADAGPHDDGVDERDGRGHGCDGVTGVIYGHSGRVSLIVGP